MPEFFLVPGVWECQQASLTWKGPEMLSPLSVRTFHSPWGNIRFASCALHVDPQISTKRQLLIYCAKLSVADLKTLFEKIRICVLKWVMFRKWKITGGSVADTVWKTWYPTYRLYQEFPNFLWPCTLQHFDRWACTPKNACQKEFFPGMGQ